MNIHYFWTWAAINANGDTTHFRIENEWEYLYVDTGHGMNLAQRVLRGEIDYPKHLFLTHCHTDHILWLPHLLRPIDDNVITIYLSEELAWRVRSIMGALAMYSGRIQKRVESGQIRFVNIDNEQPIEMLWGHLTPINIHSNKVEQFWFMLEIGGKKIVFFWDENVNILNRGDLQRFNEADWLLLESFCLDWEFNPHQIAHITAKESWIIAQKLKARSVISVHNSERFLKTTREEYLNELKKEIESEYGGSVYVPCDWDDIMLSN